MNKKESQIFLSVFPIEKNYIVEDSEGNTHYFKTMKEAKDYVSKLKEGD